MRLTSINEAFDKSLASKLAVKTGKTLPEVREMVSSIDPGYRNASWVMKILLNNDVTNELSNRLQSLLQKFESFKKKYPSHLPTNDINKYSYTDLVDLLDNLDEDDVRASFPGVKKVRQFKATEGFGIKRGKQATVRAYIVTNAESLAKIGQDAQWCTWDTTVSASFIIDFGPVIIITRDSKAISQTQLFDASMHEDSDCDEESRQEVLDLCESIRNEYAEQYRNGLGKPLGRTDS